MRKTIMHVFGSMDHGGAELRTIEIMESTKGIFNDIYFCTTSGKKGELAEELEEKGYHIKPCNIYSILFPFKFIKLIKENKINIVHTHISVVSGYIAMLAFFAGVTRRVVHFRSANMGIENSIWKKMKFFLLKLLILIFSTDILAVNKYTMENHYTFYRKIKKCNVMYNGVNNLYCDDKIKILKTKRELSLKNEKIIIHIGRFNKPKNHKKIIYIFKEFNKLHPDSILLLLGNDKTDIGAEIKELILELNLQENIRILGVQNDIKKYLTISDALLFPSLWEGLPGVVLEALSAGIPVLGSTIGGNLEIAETNVGISLLSIDEDNYVWAKELLRIANRGKEEYINESFLDSPYYINNVIMEFENFYKFN